MNGRNRKAIEDSLAAMLGGTTSTTTSQEPFTLDALRLMMADMPKPDVFLSTRMFPGPDAIIVEGSAEKFVVAHPGFWARVEYECRRDQYSATDKNDLLGYHRPLFGIQIIEVDPWPEDSPETAIWRRGYLDRLIEAIKVASVELPEWLLSPKLFGKHG